MRTVLARLRAAQPSRWFYAGPRLSATLALGRLSGRLSRLTGRGAGGTVPGRVVSLLRPSALKELCTERSVVLVSGTNGKSTTTAMIAAVLARSSAVLNNADGANLMSGLVSTVMADADGHSLAVLEVDEVTVPAALDATSAGLIVLLNLSRDQLDRVGEVVSTARRWAAALARSPGSHIVANSDDPIVVSAIRSARPNEMRVTWVAAGGPWRADAPYCTSCGAAWPTDSLPWGCAECGLCAPVPAWSLRGDALQGPDGLRATLSLRLPGRANVANALMAVASASVLGVAPTESALIISEMREIDGRYLSTDQAGRKALLLLAKNPAGWHEVLHDLIAVDPDLVVIVGLNNREADGTDPSWIWDVPFELLQGRSVVVYGECALDLAVRLHYAEVPHQLASDLQDALRITQGSPVVVAANYTAFVVARRLLRGA